MTTLFNRPLWHNPAKLISFDLDGGDASQQIFDIFSFAHVSSGIFCYFMSRLVGVQPLMGLYITIILNILFELGESIPFFVNLFKKKYPSFAGDSLINSLSDICCGVFGYILAYKWRRLSILLFIVIDLLLIYIYPYKKVFNA